MEWNEMRAKGKEGDFNIGIHLSNDEWMKEAQVSRRFVANSLLDGWTCPVQFPSLVVLQWVRVGKIEDGQFCEPVDQFWPRRA